MAVRDSVPHGAVLPAASVVVCHGGLSTIMVSLAHGVPLVCIPQGREQGMNAERVVACGAGITLSSDAAPVRIAGAVRAVLEDPSYRRVAGSIAERIAATGAGAAATRAVEALLERTGRAGHHGAGRAVGRSPIRTPTGQEEP